VERNPEREPVPLAGAAERPLSNARRQKHPKTAEGIERIRKARTIHGRYSAEMVELRREMRLTRVLVRQVAE